MFFLISDANFKEGPAYTKSQAKSAAGLVKALRKNACRIVF